MVIVVNPAFQPIGEVSLREAVGLMLRTRKKLDDRGREIEVPLVDPLMDLGIEGSFRTPRTIFEIPRVLKLTYYREAPRIQAKWSRSGVLERDENTCIYCGKYGDTIDHIIPQSRGGGNTWGNTACACEKCNNRKADRTHKEAGMPLLWEPKRPRDRTAVLETKLNKIFMQVS